jgi:hypothetical protein
VLAASALVSRTAPVAVRLDLDRPHRWRSVQDPRWRRGLCEPLPGKAAAASRLEGLNRWWRIR